MLFWLRRTSPDLPDFYRAYLEGWPERPPLQQPIGEARFVVFDTETTGLDPARDRLLSIGAVEVRDWQIDLANQYAMLIRQSDVVQGEKEIAVHGILPGRERARPEAEVIPEFLEYVGTAVVIAHHAAFDVAMIDRSLKRLGAGRLRNKVIDTGALARRVQRTSAWAPPRAFSLDELARQYNIPLSDRHTAPGDALITALVFLKLLGQLEKRGVRKLRDLLR